jgi:hypothetical protein
MITTSASPVTDMHSYTNPTTSPTVKDLVRSHPDGQEPPCAEAGDNPNLQEKQTTASRAYVMGQADSTGLLITAAARRDRKAEERGHHILLQ